MQLTQELHFSIYTITKFKSFFMTSLIFKNKNLLGILQLTEKATVFDATYSEAVTAYEKDTGKKYRHNSNLDRYYEQENPTIWLVKDEGIYLMTSAKLKETPKDGSHVCYAEGFRPDAPDSFEKCTRAMGESDFCQSIHFGKNYQEAIRRGADILIEFGPKGFTVSLLFHR